MQDCHVEFEPLGPDCNQKEAGVCLQNRQVCLLKHVLRVALRGVGQLPRDPKLHASRAVAGFGTPEAMANRRGHADLAAWLVASRGWTPLAHLETLTAARATSLLRSGVSLHEGEPTPLQRAAGGEGEAAALVRRAAALWSPASHSLFPAPARARAALLVLSLYEIHERHHLDSAGNTNGIAARDFSA